MSISKVVQYFISVIKLMAASAVHGGMTVVKNNVLVINCPNYSLKQQTFIISQFPWVKIKNLGPA